METTMNPEQMVLSEQIHLLIDQLGEKTILILSSHVRLGFVSNYKNSRQQM